MALEIGQQVKLKSGGPQMTVVGKEGKMVDGYVCEWFPAVPGSNYSAPEPKRYSFPEAALNVIDPPTPK